MFGYTTVKTSELKQLDELIEKCQNSHRETAVQLLKEREEHQTAIQDKDAEILALKLELGKKTKEAEHLSEIIQKERSQNSVTLTIGDDLTTVTPVVRSKPNAFETLFQNGYLNDAQNSQHAIELSLMLIANEALTQLLEQFESPVRGD
jgi:predicted RNase H-like nuclease (RuvC/YqgF family)